MSRVHSFDALRKITVQQPPLRKPHITSVYTRPPQAPARYIFDPKALQSLAFSERILFEYFGQGPIVPAAYECIHHAFEAQALAHPDAIAIQHLDQTITYRELDRQANRLAALLSLYGVRPGDHVALFLQRSIPMVVGILAILKVGAAYVPQHVGVAPEAQLRHIMQVARTQVVLTLSQFQAAIPTEPLHTCISIDRLMQVPFEDEHVYSVPWRPLQQIDRDQTCYILFTSGTTGTPNGVQVTHGNVVNILLSAPGNLDIKPGTKVAQILSIAFDMAAWEILGCLGNGGTLIIRGKDIQAAAQQADVIVATPSVLSCIDADQCPNVKVVAVAGEPCPKPLAERWASFATFYNSCGPTETTIVNTMQRFNEANGHLTIGRPTPNNTVYILDEQMQPCPIGEVGEMWAGGDCVSKGYLGNDTLNRERYAPDPFLGNGRMMFRTRDLGRWTPEGELEHFGRTDDQVKIRGFRIELDSVSAVLEAVPGCSQAVTLKFDNESLVAFVAPAEVDFDLARQVIAEHLPYYCTPAAIYAFDSFPITSRGKVDKQALIEHARTASDTTKKQEVEAC